MVKKTFDEQEAELLAKKLSPMGAASKRLGIFVLVGAAVGALLDYGMPTVIRGMIPSSVKSATKSAFSKPEGAILPSPTITNPPPLTEKEKAMGIEWRKKHGISEADAEHKRQEWANQLAAAKENHEPVSSESEPHDLTRTQKVFKVLIDNSHIVLGALSWGVVGQHFARKKYAAVKDNNAKIDQAVQEVQDRRAAADAAAESQKLAKESNEIGQRQADATEALAKVHREAEANRLAEKEAAEKAKAEKAAKDKARIDKLSESAKEKPEPAKTAPPSSSEIDKTAPKPETPAKEGVLVDETSTQPHTKHAELDKPSIDGEVVKPSSPDAQKQLPEPQKKLVPPEEIHPEYKGAVEPHKQVATLDKAGTAAVTAEKTVQAEASFAGKTAKILEKGAGKIASAAGVAVSVATAMMAAPKDAGAAYVTNMALDSAGMLLKSDSAAPAKTYVDGLAVTCATVSPLIAVPGAQEGVAVTCAFEEVVRTGMNGAARLGITYGGVDQVAPSYSVTIGDNLAAGVHKGIDTLKSALTADTTTPESQVADKTQPKKPAPGPT